MGLVVREAIATCLDEAKATPIAVGTTVGHTDFATYSTASGTLVAYDGDESVVETSSGEQIRWKTEGMVDIKKVYILTEKYAQRMESVAQLVEVMELMGVPAQETIETLMGAAPDGPTPGCDCPHCRQFTPEEHEAARAKLAAATADATTPNPGTESETPKAAAVGSGFPFDEFLNSIRRPEPDSNDNQ